MGGLIECSTAARSPAFAFDNGDGADVQPPAHRHPLRARRGTYLNYVAFQRPRWRDATDGRSGAMSSILAAACAPPSSPPAAALLERRQRPDHQHRSELREHQHNSSSTTTSTTWSRRLTGGAARRAKTPTSRRTWRKWSAMSTSCSWTPGSTTANKPDVPGGAQGRSRLRADRREPIRSVTDRETRTNSSTRRTRSAHVRRTDVAAAATAPTIDRRPIFYQNEASPAGDDRVTQQATPVRPPATPVRAPVPAFHRRHDDLHAQHVRRRRRAFTTAYAVDGVSSGVTADFNSTVVSTPRRRYAGERDGDGQRGGHDASRQSRRCRCRTA